MALTVAQLAGALRLGDGVAAPAEPVLGILTRLMTVGNELVGEAAPDAPAAVKEEAVIRFAGYVYDMPPAARNDGYANAWRNSGAGSLVARWVERRAAQEPTT